MKKVFFFLLGLLVLCACKEEKQQEPEMPGTPPDEIILTVSPEQLTVD